MVGAPDAALDMSRRLVKEGMPAPRFTIRDGRRILIPVDFLVLPTDYPYQSNSASGDAPIHTAP
jgi:hypothetical protein